MCKYPDAAWLSIAGGDHGLGDSQGADLAVVEHHGCRFLCRSPGEGADALRQAGDFQHRPRSLVHWLCLHQRAAGCRGADQHGRTERRMSSSSAFAAHPNMNVYLHAFETERHCSLALTGGSALTLGGDLIRGWQGELRQRPMGGSALQIMGGIPPRSDDQTDGISTFEINLNFAGFGDRTAG